MISVRYDTISDFYNGIETIGWDFADEEQVRYRMYYEEEQSVNWRGYVIWCVNENYSVINIFVNNHKVWNKHDGWLVDIYTHQPF
jgi:hypothetical protein